MKKKYKKAKYVLKRGKSGKLKKYLPTVLAVVFLVLLRYCVYLISESNKNNTDDVSYSGVIEFCDCASRTIKGNDYSFINTILSEFCSGYGNVRVNLNRISALTPEETASYTFENGNHPDVIRSVIGDYRAQNDGALQDERLTEKLTGMYAPYVNAPSSSSYVSVDMYSNASVLLVNNDILSQIGVDAHIYDKTPESFLNLIDEITRKDTSNEYIHLDYCINDAYSYLPFLLSYESNEDNEGFLNSLKMYLPADHESRSITDVQNDFYNAKSAVCSLSLKEVNYMLRRCMNQRGFNFSIIMFPSSSGQFVFIRDTISYMFYDTGNYKKNELIKELAVYMLSDESQKYTENIGMLPCGKVKLEYESYPHLKEMTNSDNTYYTYRDDKIIKLYEEYSQK